VAIDSGVGAGAEATAPRIASYTMLLLFLAMTFAQLDLHIASYVAGSIKSDFHLTDTQLGLLLGASFGLFYTLVGVPLAWFVDRYSRRMILGLGIVTWSLGTAFCGIAQNYWNLFAARLFVGAGEAVNQPTSLAIIGDLYPREQLPRAIATMQSGLVIGGAIALLLSSYALHLLLHLPPIKVPFGVIHGWQLIFIIVGLPGVVVGGVIATTMPAPPIRARPSAFSVSRGAGRLSWFVDYRQAFSYMGSRWQVYSSMFLSLALGILANGGSLQWKPILFSRTFEWSPARVAALDAVVSLGMMPLFLVVGVWITEYLQKRGRHDAPYLVFLISRCLVLPCSMLAPLMPNAWVCWALLAISTSMTGVSGPAQNTVIQSITPSALRGKITSFWMLIYSVVGFSVGPLAVALITDLVLEDESQIKWALFWMVAIFSTLSLIVSFFGLKPYAREIARLANTAPSARKAAAR
jgi:MFS family permease